MEYRPMPYLIIDSHCHLDFPKFNRDREETILRAREAGVVGMINSGISLKGNRMSLELAEKNGKAVGIGEAGLDFQDCKTNDERERQTAAFKKVVALAKDLDKPLVVHARLAEAEVLKLVKDIDTVIYHCYSGSVETMQEIVDMGYYISLATLVCFSRKGRNEPAFIVDSVPVVAQLKGIDPAEIAKSTTRNARRVFNI